MTAIIIVYSRQAPLRSSRATRARGGRILAAAAPPCAPSRERGERARGEGRPTPGATRDARRLKRCDDVVSSRNFFSFCQLAAAVKYFNEGTSKTLVVGTLSGKPPRLIVATSCTAPGVDDANMRSRSSTRMMILGVRSRSARSTTRARLHASARHTSRDSARPARCRG